MTGPAVNSAAGQASSSSGQLTFKGQAHYPS